MADEKSVTVIPAPLGLTLLDPQGGPALPIVALQVVRWQCLLACGLVCRSIGSR